MCALYIAVNFKFIRNFFKKEYTYKHYYCASLVCWVIFGVVWYFCHLCIAVIITVRVCVVVRKCAIGKNFNVSVRRNVMI